MGLQRMGAGPYDFSHAPTPIALGSGATFMIPAGQYHVVPGIYTFLQWWDAGTQIWRNMTSPSQPVGFPVSSDGYNWRLANMTGCVVGAVVTNGGTGYTNGIYPAGTGTGTLASPLCTFAVGGGSIVATGNMVVGGAINTTIAITAGGSNYTRPPVLVIDPPPQGGVPATAVCTLTAGAIAAVTVTNQGAGYSSVPAVRVINGPGDTTGTGARLTVNATLALTGQLIAITMANNGATHNAVPAISFTPNPATVAATAIMCWTVTTGVAQTAMDHAGTGNIGFVSSTVTAGSSTSTNPSITTDFFKPRMGYTALNTTAGGGITFLDGGLHQIIPIGIAYALLSDGTVPASATKVVQTVGGAANDLSYLLPL